MVAVGSLIVLVYLIFLAETGPEERDARPPIQPVQQEIEQWPQQRQIDDQEMRLQKLERDLWERENSALMSGKK